jgi:hypothetical protein
MFSLNSLVKYRLRQVFSTTLIAVHGTLESRMRKKSPPGQEKSYKKTTHPGKKNSAPDK